MSEINTVSGESGEVASLPADSAVPAESAVPAKSYVRVCSVEDLPQVGAVQASIGDQTIAVVRDSAGDIHAIDDTCSHANVSLSEGDVEDGEIECWLHGSRFDLRSGKPTGLPATSPISVYPVKIDGDDVLVSVTKES
jgi:3-phenylpropionate/trans-cinnamate dioxygenase ferredoxin component